MNKTLLIVCTVIIVLAIAVPTTIVITNKVNESDAPSTNNFASGMMEKIDADTTFEEYSKDFKDDVTEEQIAEAEEIFNQLQDAISSDDTDTTRSLMMQLNQLGLFDTDGQMPGMGQGQRPDGQGQKPNRN